ncbi:MAG: Putative short-chain fatty acid transporter [Desulfovibrio sp.]
MNFVSAFGQKMSDWAERNMPNPFLFAIVLSIIVWVAGVAFTSNGPLDMVNHWYGGFWKNLAFGMQMVLILVTGHALAIAPGIRPALQRLASTPQNMAGAVLLTAYLSCAVHYIHWGLGLVVSALFAREVATQAAKRNIPMHYPLLAAAAFSGHMFWHVGPSTSAGLLSATPGHMFEGIFGIVPMSASVFTTYGFGLVIALGIFFIPWTMRALTPKDISTYKPIGFYVPDFEEAEKAEKRAEEAEEARPKNGFADMLEQSRAISLLVAAAGFTYLVTDIVKNGFRLDINLFNFIFMTVGILLHKTPIRYVRAIQSAIGGTSGIVLQFPFYAGIMGMTAGSGLTEIITKGFIAISTPESFPVWTWLAAGFINVFIPSGGGEWAAMGGILGETAKAMNVPVGKMIVAFGCGDMWTNMYQPFWAIALLGIMGLKAREMMGYCIVLATLAAPVFGLLLYFLPY